MLQTIFDIDVNLRSDPESLRKYGGANDRGKRGFNQPLPTDNDAHALLFGVERMRFDYEVKIATLHLVRIDLIPQNVFGLFAEIFRVGINDLEISRASIFGRSEPEAQARRTFQKTRPVGIGLVNLRQQFLREQN